MARLSISHHERVGGDDRRWLVHVAGRTRPLAVELPEEDRLQLDLSDEEIHALLPTAVERRLEESAGTLPDETLHDVMWDAPVRVLQTHFMA